MAYGSKVKGVPSEMASKIGHLSVIEDEFVQSLLKSFESAELSDEEKANIPIEDVELGESASKVICVDGSFAVVPHALKDHKRLAYIKIAAIGLNIDELEKANKVIVNPEVVSKIISDYATTQSTVLPLENISIPGKTLKDTLRESIFKSFEKLFEGKLLEILVYLISRSWKKDFDLDAHFECPYCGHKNNVPKNTVKFNCENSKCSSGTLTIVDYLGFLSQNPDDQSDDKVARDLMLVLEHLTLFYYLKELEENGETLSDYLLLKDGPLLLSGQYSRLVDPMREYLDHLQEIGNSPNFLGVEKSGPFFTHGEDIKSAFQEDNQIFIPSNKYIFEKIKYSVSDDTQYGERVLYGSKLFYSPSKSNIYVLTIPIGSFKVNPTSNDFIGLKNVLATLNRLQSHRYDSGLAPIVAVNSIASMSFYPSNNILGRFTNHYINNSKE